jgi:hypothetical protein
LGGVLVLVLEEDGREDVGEVVWIILVTVWKRQLRCLASVLCWVLVLPTFGVIGAVYLDGQPSQRFQGSIHNDGTVPKR